LHEALGLQGKALPCAPFEEGKRALEILKRRLEAAGRLLGQTLPGQVQPEAGAGQRVFGLQAQHLRLEAGAQLLFEHGAVAAQREGQRAWQRLGGVLHPGEALAPAARLGMALEELRVEAEPQRHGRLLHGATLQCRHVVEHCLEGARERGPVVGLAAWPPLGEAPQLLCCLHDQGQQASPPRGVRGRHHRL
jgi:hypothetical protein